VAIGIPCLTAEPETVKTLQALLQENPQAPISVDLEAMQVHCGDILAAVSLAEGPRQMLTTGTWDTCGQLIAQTEHIRVATVKLPYLNWGTPMAATP